jgi:hypothetical protein
MPIQVLELVQKIVEPYVLRLHEAVFVKAWVRPDV